MWKELERDQESQQLLFSLLLPVNAVGFLGKRKPVNDFSECRHWRLCFSSLLLWQEGSHRTEHRGVGLKKLLTWAIRNERE